MKKVFSLLLVLTMLTALCVPALAEDMDEALKAVTLKVKETLDISDDYTDYSGSWEDWLQGCWYLNWSNDTSTVSVTADVGGKVMDYWRYEYEDDSEFFYGFAPAFPAIAQDEAQELAEQWLAGLCGEGESAVIESCYADLGSQEYLFNGAIYLNELPSPITFCLTLNDDGTVQSYNRSDCYGGYAGEIPVYEERESGTAPAKLLADTVAMELYWVSDGGDSASLRYVPCSDRYVVTYPDGALTDMDELYAGFTATGYGLSNSTADRATEAAAAEDAGAGRALTETELAAADAYADAMTAEELDAALRAISQLGLDDGFALQSSRYSQDDDGNIDCTLTYIKTMDAEQLYGFSMDSYQEALDWGYDMDIRKYITLDAKTGELKSVSTNYPLYEERKNEKTAGTQAIAEAFLQAAAPEKLACCEYCTLSGYEGVWAQLEDGYFFPENALTVEINEASGTVDNYYVNWNDDISFGNTKVIGEDKAKEAYIDGLTLAFGYVAWPVGVYDDPVYESYADWGYDWAEKLCLAWYYDGTEEIAAVDAVSGELISAVAATENYSYEDLDGCGEQAAIEKLGVAGVGIPGGKFEPEKTLDMRTAAKLLLQATGWTAAAWDDEALCEQCVNYNMLSAEEWEPDKSMSRMDFIKMLLSATEYGKACELYGVWSADFTDRADIAKADMGYAAVAQGLKIVTDGKLDGGADCTRAMAACMLAAFMER